jgi:hypothetical protein
LLASVALAVGAAFGVHGLLRGPAAPVPAGIDADAPPERRAREALVAYVESLGYHTDETESAGFIDVFGEPGVDAAFDERRLVFVARQGEDPHRDVFLLRARVAPNGAPLSVGTIYNLTRTADGDEAWLTPRPGQVAFTTRFAHLYTGVTVLDLNGTPPEPGATLEALLTRALTDLLEIGDWRGVHVARYILTEPAADMRLSWEGDELNVARREGEGWREARLDLGSVAARRPPDVPWLRAVETHRAPRSLLSWAVDTARSVSFIGPERIYALETVFFRLADTFQTARFRLMGGVVAPLTGEAAQAPEPPPPPPPEAAGVVDPLGPWPLEAPPPDITPRLDPPLPGEGRWRPFHFAPATPGAPPIFWRTTIRVDTERPDAITELVLVDPRQAELRMVGGTEHPRSTTGEVGTGMVPGAVRGQTLAAFNGGFQAVHGNYGMVVDKTVLLPPLPQVATVATYADGSALMGTWADDGGPLPKGLVSLRQNLPPLADRGQFNPLGRRTWGFTIKGSDPIFTWRSGMGVTRAGFLVFGVCVRCSADTLADGLMAADAEYAMHLDMNISNIGWEFWRPGADAGRIERQSLMPDMWRSEDARYVDPHTRDFFYLVSRPMFPVPEGQSWVHPLSGAGLPRPQGMWPPPLARGELRAGAGTLSAVRVDAEALGARAGEAEPGWCELLLHRGATGEGLPHRDLGEAPRTDRVTLQIGVDGRLSLLAPADLPAAGSFYQQLVPVVVGGVPVAGVVAGPARWLLGVDARRALWLLGGEVDHATLLAGAASLGLVTAGAPMAGGVAPTLRCGDVAVLSGPRPPSVHRLALGRATTPPLWPLMRTTDFPDRR